jgi:F420-non-reducing hydrogenase small subunit
MKMAKVAMMQLASCWGCNQSLVDAHLTLLHVLPELEFVYWPAVVDFKLKHLKSYEDQSVDVGFLEGFCRTENDIANVELMRKKCKILVAIGSCAVLGGCPGMANLFDIEDLTARKFMDTEYVDEGSKVPTQHVPKFLDAIPDLHTVAKIDVDLPGCPPKTGNIIGLIATVLGEVATTVDASKSMCDVCPLGTCLLDNGTLCYGAITAAGDPIGKLAGGYPVLGEFGLTKNVNADKAAKLLAKITSGPMNKAEVSQTVETLMMTLNSVPLGYLVGKADPIRAVKLDPESIKMKSVSVSDKTIEVVDFKVDGYSDVINDIIGAAMADLKSNPLYEDSAKTVCSSCDRNVQDKEVIRYKRDYEGMPDTEKCLLIQGYVCMGPITKAGCGATCCRANSPCLGCYGPALNVDDFGSKAMSLFPAICKDEPENIKKFFKDPAGLFNRFCVPTSTLARNIKEE